MKNNIDEVKHFMKCIKNNTTQTHLNKNRNSINLSVQGLVKKMRILNEDESRKTVYDQPLEEEKFLNNFKDININVKFIELEIYEDLVFWGGTIDGIIQFAYKVTRDEATSGVEFNYLPDFSPDNPENEDIVTRVEGYYDAFYKYWQSNLLQT
jgi:hypothetical protein